MALSSWAVALFGNENAAVAPKNDLLLIVRGLGPGYFDTLTRSLYEDIAACYRR